MQEGRTKKLLRRLRVLKDGDNISRVNQTAGSPEQDKRSSHLPRIRTFMALQY